MQPPKSGASVLIVDDDLRLRALLERYLREQGYETRGVASAEQMRKALERGHFDMLVLDLMLPDEDGLSICARLRGEGSDIPVLMLTAKGDEIDRIVGLEIGADDYLPKPCNPRELVARIKAILRRHTRPAPGAPRPGEQAISFGSYRLDLETRQLTRDGTRIPLTTGEFSLLGLLAQNPNLPLSRERLLTLTRGRDHSPFDRSVDVQISRLRRLIEEDPTQPRYIQTVWGVGYVFVPDGKAR